MFLNQKKRENELAYSGSDDKSTDFMFYYFIMYMFDELDNFGFTPIFGRFLQVSSEPQLKECQGPRKFVGGLPP